MFLAQSLREMLDFSPYGFTAKADTSGFTAKADASGVDLKVRFTQHEHEAFGAKTLL